MNIQRIEGPNEGKFIPAQKVTAVYRLEGSRLVKIDTSNPFWPEIFVNHFQTCPHAREFSKSKGKK